MVGVRVGLDIAQRLGAAAFARVQFISTHTLFSLNSSFSLASLVGALSLAALFIAASRLRRRGRLSPRLLLKALWPRGAVLGPSGKADLGFFLFNTFSAGGLISWALLTQDVVGDWTLKALDGRFGPVAPHRPDGLSALVFTVTVYLAADFAYWLDHWTSHYVPCLWEIHKVHHTAEGLSPFTNFRVHPLETLKFYNIVALVSGAMVGINAHLYGFKPSHLQVLQTDVISLTFTLTILHLQHSHVWISLRGLPGRLIMSPAHHQVHHSTDERHFGKNLGGAFAIWDLMFGTLYVPAARRERLVFGVAGETEAAHSVTGTLITPMVRAARVLVAALPWRIAGPFQRNRTDLAEL